MDLGLTDGYEILGGLKQWAAEIKFNSESQEELI